MIGFVRHHRAESLVLFGVTNLALPLKCPRRRCQKSFIGKGKILDWPAFIDMHYDIREI